MDDDDLNIQFGCYQCHSAMALISTGTPTYKWRCKKGCAPDLDTRIPVDKDLNPFREKCISHGKIINGLIFGGPLFNCEIPVNDPCMPGIKVFMPHLLSHAIPCGSGFCYNSLDINCFRPHLDNPDVVDFVLRGGVVSLTSGAWQGLTGAIIYPDLHNILASVESSEVRDYIWENFQPRSA